jgi:23S rRNA (guanosine2251-2'-O)-methyltransferase
VEVEGGTLTSLAGFDGHQGIALVTDRRKFAGLDDLLARAIERKEAPFVLVLDSLEDPQNFGSLLRTAEASGVHGVVYPTHRQAPLSAAAIKASAGAVEHLLLVPVDDLADALTDLHVRGLRIIGTDADAPLTTRQADLRGPVVIVVGSEGQGLGPAVRRRCDAVVRIPMRGKVGSLNASVAGSILLYEASSQRAGDRLLIADKLPGPDFGPEDEEAFEPAALEPAAPEPAEGGEPMAAPGAEPRAGEPAAGPAIAETAAQPTSTEPAPEIAAGTASGAGEPVAEPAATAKAPARRKATRPKAASTPDAAPEATADPEEGSDDALLPGARQLPGAAPLPGETLAAPKKQRSARRSKPAADSEPEA